jgi:hypothetical protein
MVLPREGVDELVASRARLDHMLPPSDLSQAIERLSDYVLAVRRGGARREGGARGRKQQSPLEGLQRSSSL